MNEITIVIITALSSLVSSTLTFLFTRRKNKAEAKMSELDTIDKAITIWRSLAQDLEKKVEELEQKIDDLESQQKQNANHADIVNFTPSTINND